LVVRRAKIGEKLVAFFVGQRLDFAEGIRLPPRLIVAVGVFC
jgi:hypothetical protein